MATKGQKTYNNASSRMKPDINMPQSVNEAGRMAHSAATSKWMTMLARLGYAMKGVVYLLIGFLAAQLAFGLGGKATDQKGALQTISDLPLGKFLLIIAIIGLIGFALWCFIQTIFDTEGKGKDTQGIIARIGYAIVGISYATFAFAAFQLALGSGSGGKSSTTNTQDWTATLLKHSFGVALVVIVGLVVLAVAGYLLYKAYSAKFQDRLNLSEMSAQVKKWAIYMGRFGYAALGVVFTIIAIFLMVAAFQHNASKAVGLDGALRDLSYQPFGKLLLAVVALGLIAYGVFSFVEARYRRIGR